MLRPNASPRGGGGKSDEPNFSFLVTLLTMLDFSEPGKVTQEDWDRGMGNLWAPGVGSAVSWGSLQKRFDKGGSGQIDFGEIIGLADNVHIWAGPHLGRFRPLGHSRPESAPQMSDH